MASAIDLTDIEMVECVTIGSVQADLAEIEYKPAPMATSIQDRKPMQIDSQNVSVSRFLSDIYKGQSVELHDDVSEERKYPWSFAPARNPTDTLRTSVAAKIRINQEAPPPEPRRQRQTPDPRRQRPAKKLKIDQVARRANAAESLSLSNFVELDVLSSENEQQNSTPSSSAAGSTPNENETLDTTTALTLPVKRLRQPISRQHQAPHSRQFRSNESQQNAKNQREQRKIQNMQMLPAERAARAREYRFRNRNDTQTLMNYLLSLDFFSIARPLIILRNRIPDKFSDGQWYVDYFRPFYLEEVRAEIEAANLAMNLQNYSVVTLLSQESDETDLFMEFNIGPDLDTESNLFYQNFAPDDLVICVEYRAHAVPKYIDKWKRPQVTYFLGIVTGTSFSMKLMTRKMEQTAKIPRSRYFQILYISKVTTMFREFKTISSAEFMALGDVVMNPELTVSLKVPLPVPEQFWYSIEEHFNESQMTALVKICQSKEGFNLIQGPPGTGKTHTILGLLSSILLWRDEAKPRILVCAPSNAGIDELTVRVLKFGLISETGGRVNYNYLKIGGTTTDHKEMRERKEQRQIDKYMTNTIQSISLKAQLDARIATENMTDSNVLIRQHKDKLHKIRDALDRMRDNEKATQELLREKNRIAQNIADAKYCKRKYKDRVKAIEREIIQNADVIFATLSAAGQSDVLSIWSDINYVIIDEACQCIEPSWLIPLQYGAKHVTLVGDPMQLPATTFSKEASDLGLSRSLFERLQKCGTEVSLLTVQYRMVKQIRIFPSMKFYAGKLTDDSTIEFRKQPAWIPRDIPLFFFDLTYTKESRNVKETSICNRLEASFIVELYANFTKYHGRKLNIGVITPYKKQVEIISTNLGKRFGSEYQIDVEVNTIDGFQGREKDVIIFSCVRSGDTIGFLSDYRRMNVALTRAKFALWIVGRSETLQLNSDWNALINYTESEKCIRQVNDRYFKIDTILH